jgi:hypothetical protein
MNKILALEK